MRLNGSQSCFTEVSNLSQMFLLKFCRRNKIRHKGAGN